MIKTEVFLLKCEKNVNFIKKIAVIKNLHLCNHIVICYNDKQGVKTLIKNNESMYIRKRRSTGV